MVTNTANTAQSYPVLSSMRGMASGLSPADKRSVVAEIIGVIRDYYSHLPLKVSALATDPLGQLRLLNEQIDDVSTDIAFFSRTLTILNQLRDRHTSLVLPAPYSGMLAFLPFVIEAMWESSVRVYRVSKIAFPSSLDARFVVGVRITHWNGIDIERYLDRLSWDTAGAHPEARVAVAARSLTARALAFMHPPDEDWVVVSYEDASGVASTAIPWRVYLAEDAGAPASSKGGVVSGIDRVTHEVNRGWRQLFAGAVKPVREDVLFAVDPFAQVPNPLPDNISFRLVKSGDLNFGYVRIYSFETDDPRTFLESFAQVLRMLPATGLILDVRANPGGQIPAGEGLLQLLSLREIATEALQFRNTAPASAMVSALQYFTAWRRSMTMSASTGEVFSQGYTLTDPATSVGLSGVYSGKSVLIVDALSYSTTDFFAAGFQDNGLGFIIGTDSRTGGGGANVWSHSDVCSAMGGQQAFELKPMPMSMDLSFALRRSSRVGLNYNLPVEGIGVAVDFMHYLTPQDVLGNNEDLLAFAGSVLSRQSD